VARHPVGSGKLFRVYAERLTVPLRWWVQATMLVATFWLAAIVAFPLDLAWIPWTVTGLLFLGIAAGLASYGRAQVAVTDHRTLVAGPAEIDLDLVGDVVALDADQTRSTAGRDADARAFLVLRPYLRHSVKVTITDPSDPAPYWLVSCRRPERVVAAVEASRTHG